MKNKYALLYLKTGGGHLAPARSIAAYLQKNHAESIEPALVDGFTQTPKIVRSLVEDGYRQLQARAAWVYGLIYLVNKILFIARLNSAVVSFFVKPYLERMILQERPDKIIIFHFLLIKPVFDILRHHRLSIPVITVVTDPYTAHPMWFLQKEQHLIVFSEELRHHCIQQHIAPQQVSVFPFILDEQFSRPMSSEAIVAIKQRLGLTPEKKLILIMGGADGIPKGKSILKHLIKSNSSAEIAMVCGNNEALYNETMAWKNKHRLKNVHIYGYIDFAYELLNASDVVVTKCGASMFMQILMSKKIPIVNSYLWEQEKGNVEFLEKRKMGIYEKNVRKLPLWIDRITSDSTMSLSFKQNIENASLENGTDKVSRFIMNFQGI